MQIVFVSGHYPSDTHFARSTRRSFEQYTKRHGYGFYYDDSSPSPAFRAKHELHYRRCIIFQKAAATFPNADWYIWVDSDVFVNKPDMRIEDCIDLTDKNILYHLFHEKPWSFPINTGVKIVNRIAIPIESTIYTMRNTPPWNEFPYEQKITAEYVIPKIQGQYKIHDPYLLNYILYQIRDTHNDPTQAVFIHLCTRTTDQRNKIMHIFETENRIMDQSEDSTIVNH